MTRDKTSKTGLSVPEKKEMLAEKKKSPQRASSNTGPTQDQINLLLDHYRSSRFVEAEGLAVLLTQQFPNHSFAWKVLGAIFNQAGKLNESLEAKLKAVELSPQDAEAHSNLGGTLKDLGRLGDAEMSYRQATALKPDFAVAHYNLGSTLQELGRLEEAEASYKKTIVMKPDFAEAHSNLGATLEELGRLDEAEGNYRQAIALKPDFAEAHSNLGGTLKELGRLHEAEASYKKAIAVKPGFSEAHSNLGGTLKDLGRLDDAEASYRRAIALKPDYAKAHSNLGSTLQELGRLEDAEASYRRATALKSDFAEAQRNLAMMKKFSSRDEQFLEMQTLYHDPTISEDDLCRICFALAKACDDLEDIAEAFQFYREGNALRKKKLGYEKAKDQKLFEKLKTSFPSIISHAFEPEIVAPEHTPIFIVGMPRSGTTLAEQIISSHPLVTGAGELNFVSQFGNPMTVGQPPLNDAALTRFREQYLNALQQRSEGNAIVTDKMPQNFRFLGLIATALPEAKIIHVKRHPAAVCWGNYTKHFVNDSLGYCYSLGDILHYHELYEDLMGYWHQVLPSKIYDLDYEVLTEHQEEETRKLIDHLGLEWSEACLSPQDNKRSVATASSAQVRKKVYQGSSERWKLYRKHLNGAFDHFKDD